MSSPDPFTIILRNEKVAVNRKLALAFTLVNLIIFILLLFSRATLFTGIAGLGIIISYLTFKKLRYKQRRLYNMVGPKIFYLLTIVWFFQSVFIAIFVFLTGVLLKFSTQPFKYIFYREEIVRDFFPRKTYSWSAMNFVILKDGILTLDFKNNHLIQLPVENPEEVETPLFNEFVRKQLESSELSSDN